MPLISVIVPVFGSAEMLEKCLLSIRRSSFTDYEILVADDHSPDGPGIARTAGRYGASVVRLDRNLGPGAARNAAARKATGDIFLFVDADVTILDTTLGNIAARFAREPGLDALMGSYDSRPANHGMVALFRNLMHAHVHQRSSTHATTFWAGCGAIRRGPFLASGGFDESRCTLEDVDLGVRLHAAGATLALDPRIEVTHHKEWTLGSMIRTDVLDRAVPWTRVLMERGLPHDLNFRWQDRGSAVLALLLPALTFLSLRFGRAWWALTAVAAVAIPALQWPLFRFLARTKGWLFSLASFPLYVVHSLSAAAGLGIGLWKWETSRDRRFGWVLGALALLIFAGIQLAGGAYTAEFDGHPDEAAHFMTGLMLRDFLVQWPIRHPISWVEQYYVHYPKLMQGHWPPLFHALEAACWLFVEPSRTSAMLLIGLIGLAAAAAFYRLARELASPWVAFPATCLLVVSPVFQDSVSMVMCDVLALLVAVLLLGALARFCHGGSQRAFLTAGALVFAGLMVKGTGICLLPALLLAPLLSRQYGVLRSRYLWAAVGLLGIACLAWYRVFSPAAASMAAWAGASPGGQWQIANVSRVAGPGTVVLAAAGFLLAWRQKRPVAMASAAVLGSIAGNSFFPGAMNEPRVWIMALPPLLLLSLACLGAARELPSTWRVPATAVAAALLLGLFPWQWRPQKPAGYQRIAPFIHHPATVMVAGSVGWEEGSWIVLGSLREPRPSSLIFRASTVFPHWGRTGSAHGAVAASQPAMEATLDRLGVETVILDRHFGRARDAAEFTLLRETVSQDAVWLECVSAAGLSVYQRRTPLTGHSMRERIDLRCNLGRVLPEKSHADGH